MDDLSKIDLSETVTSRYSEGDYFEEWQASRYKLEVSGWVRFSLNTWTPDLKPGDDLTDLDALALKKCGDVHRKILPGARIWDAKERRFLNNA